MRLRIQFVRYLILMISALPICVSAAEIPQGARVMLRLENSVNTRTAKEGDTVYLRTSTPIAGKSRILVPIGSYVQGVITRSQRSARVHGQAQMAIALQTLMLPNGTTVDIGPRIGSVDSNGSDQRVTGKDGKIEQQGDGVKDAGRIVAGAFGGLFGGAAAGGLIGGIAGNASRGAGIGIGAGIAFGVVSAILARGKEVELRPGTTVDAIFDRAVTIPE